MRVLTAALVAAFVFMAVVLPAHAQSWNHDPDHAVLPGVGIGPIYLGMPEALARRAALRFGRPWRTNENGLECFGNVAEFCFSTDAGVVDEILATRDTEFYLVTPDEMDDPDAEPHLLVSGDPAEITDWLDAPDAMRVLPSMVQGTVMVAMAWGDEGLGAGYLVDDAGGVRLWTYVVFAAR